MATYIFDRLIMRKVQIDKVSASTRIFGISFYKKCLLSSPYVSYAFVQIAEFDRLPGLHKG